MFVFFITNKGLTLLAVAVTVLLCLVIHFALAALWPCIYGHASMVYMATKGYNIWHGTWSFYTNFDYSINHEKIDSTSKYCSELTSSRSAQESPPFKIKYYFTDILQYWYNEAFKRKHYISLLLILLAILVFSLNNFKQKSNTSIYQTKLFHDENEKKTFRLSNQYGLVVLHLLSPAASLVT